MTHALLESQIATATPHETMAAAIEAAARADTPLAVFHGGNEPVALDARAAFRGAQAWARLLVHHGVKRGDRVVLLVPTGPVFVTALLGTMLAGAAAVPLATPLTFGSIEPFLRNLGAILKSADARALVVSPRVLKVLQTQGGDLPIPPVVLTDADLLGAPTGDVSLPEIDGTDTALIQYTSGTTGQPKGVVIPHAALVSNAFAIAKGLHITPSDVGVSWLPLFHDMGLIGVLLTAVAHPYALHLAGPEYFAMGAERWMRLASKVHATITAAPNFAYEHCAKRANKLDGERLDSLRLALNGAEPVHASTVRRFAAALETNGLSPTISLPVYGMAECTLAVSFAEPGALHTMSVDRARLEHDGVVMGATGDDAREVVSVGAPVAGTSVRVADEAGNTLPTGRVGVLRVRGTSVMNGYFRNDDASASALAGGWLDTGDLGFIADGRVYVTGRAKDLIIQGGRNVYPYDLERIATEAGDLRAGGVVAFGRTGDDSGTESIVLVAECSEKDPAKREALVRELRGAILAILGVKVEDIHLVPLGAVPRTTSGKARRRECARLLETGVIG